MQNFNFGRQGMMGGISPELLKQLQAQNQEPPLPGPDRVDPVPPGTPNPDLYSDPEMGGVMPAVSPIQ